MGSSEETCTIEQAESVVNRTLAIGAVAVLALVVVALVSEEEAATAAVAAVGTIVVALARLAAAYLCRTER